MRDPHVVFLQYRLVPDEDVTYESPPPVEHEDPAFSMRLSEGLAQFDMKEHYASEEEARRPVEQFLQAWEIDSSLRPGSTCVRFAFKRAQVIDRCPPPPGTYGLEAETLRPTVTGFAPRLHVTRRAYSPPPLNFIASPDVETLWYRYQLHRQGREPLPSMAYFCLTVLEASAGGPPKPRQKAARKYAIDEDVLRKLGELSSARGDAKAARKMSRTPTPHTPAEVEWIHSALKAIIRRVGEVDAGAANTAEITLADLPRI